MSRRARFAATFAASFASPPGLPPGLPLPALAQTLAFMARPVEFIEGCHRRYGDCFTLNTILFGVEVVVVDPEVIKQVFTGDPDVYRAGEANVLLAPIVGRRSVLLLDGTEHIRHRRLLLPPFHGERILAYEATMREVTEAAVKRFPSGRAFALHPFMQGITLDVILRTVFGLDEGAHSSELRTALPRVLDRMQNPVASFALAPAFQKSFHGLSPWDSFRRDMARVDELVHAQIARRRKNSGGQRTDVLAMMLEASDEDGKALTDAELRDELMTLLVAGHETTATMLCWAMDFILHDARVRARLEDELAGGADPSKNEYLDATLKEVLRLRPVIPAVGRRLSAPMTVAGYAMPAGTFVVPECYLTHRLPAYYPDPTAFRPERFLDRKADPYAWFPFGGGARRCLGMAFAMFELKVVLATVLRTVRLRKVTASPARVALRGFTIVPGAGADVVVDGAQGPNELHAAGGPRTTPQSG